MDRKSQEITTVGHWEKFKRMNTLWYSTTPDQWTRYRRYGIFGCVEAKTFMGYGVNNGTFMGWVLKYIALSALPVVKVFSKG
jgi:hypothetical protein